MLDREEIDALNAGRKVLAGLLAQTADGDRAAFERLYNKTSAKLYGIIRRILTNTRAADEAHQETYLAIWNQASRFDPDRASPITWMAVIARNKAIDLRRRAGERIFDGAAELDLALPSAAPDALMMTEMSEELSRLSDCLDGLKDEHKEMVLLAYYEGWSRDELGTKYDRPVATVKTILRRSLIALKGCLDGIK